MILKLSSDNWLWLLLSIFTVWRITTLICYEAGPFNIISKLRLLLYKIKLGRLIDCFHCAAVWISIITVILIYPLSGITVILIFGIAGAVSIIEKVLADLSYLNQNNNHEED